MAMVSLGSCLFTLLGETILAGQTDPTRIAAQVVTGIGFLGAGAILRDRGGIRGLTTAATIWVVAAIGMAAGFGQYAVAVGSTALVVVALVVMRLVREPLMRRLPSIDDVGEEGEDGDDGDDGPEPPRLA